MRIRILILSAAVAAGGVGISTYEHYTARYPSTDDAYISANVVQVAPQVSGAVDRVAVSNHQRVAKGDPLFSIEEAPFRYALQQAQSQLALARQQVAQDEAAVASAKAEVHRREVLLENARARNARAHRLVKKSFLSQQDVEDAEAEYKSAQANLDVARASLNEARERMGQPGDANDKVVAAKARLDQARWQLDHAHVNAACTGQVSELDLQPGTVARADNPQFVLICNDAYWVIANYKETDLDRIRAGQPVQVDVDMYPGRSFHGRVESISGASGSAFSLLPPQNASGNWVKVTQRVPVKIRVTDVDPGRPLRVGTSAVVMVDTTVDGGKHLQASRSARSGRGT